MAFCTSVIGELPLPRKRAHLKPELGGDHFVDACRQGPQPVSDQARGREEQPGQGTGGCDVIPSGGAVRLRQAVQDGIG